MRRALLILALLAIAPAAAAEPDASGWWPTHLQLGASAWRVPDISGTTRRYDLNATAVWRKDTGRGYFEAGFGPCLLSRTIHNDTTSLPSELQFGSHVGAGLRLGGRRSIHLTINGIAAGLRNSG